MMNIRQHRNSDRQPSVFQHRMDGGRLAWAASTWRGKAHYAVFGAVVFVSLMLLGAMMSGEGGSLAGMPGAGVARIVALAAANVLLSGLGAWLAYGSRMETETKWGAIAFGSIVPAIFSLFMLYALAGARGWLG
ncbi:hypothetical protein [Ferruginivarius sediminum]|uniref:Uncharacterized protein n=1 Tax=Ferruginivarius sediminum TaxID=2661937 RepID=A0A369TAK2_9PROT|nr:hypothetical protein [Ferruginivarius sediminum]RDD61524.1 hypothetical protein DRB17_12555 [Ferruginivarius sediminum]